MKYHKAAVGGTFDHFHAGHKQLLTTALQVADSVVVGITQPQLIANKPLSSVIEPLDTRKANVQQFLNQQHNGETQLVALSDSFGPTLNDTRIDALVVSEQTVAGADTLNHHRQQGGLPPLPVIVASMVQDDRGQYISSTQIRYGRITREGRVYQNLFNQDIQFTPNQLLQLKAIQGQLVTNEQLPSATKTIIIGDKVTQYFLDHHLDFDYAIVDGKTRRHVINTSYPNQLNVSPANPPGSINHGLANELVKLSTAINKNRIFKIEGEEDLLAFVPLLTEPLDSIILYGQPDRGIVMIQVTETEKTRFARFLNRTF